MLLSNARLRIVGYSTDISGLWSIDSTVLTTQANTFKYLGNGNMDGAPIFVFDTGFTKIVGMQIKTEKRLNNTALLINKRVIDWLKNRDYTVGHDEL